MPIEERTRDQEDQEAFFSGKPARTVPRRIVRLGRRQQGMDGVGLVMEKELSFSVEREAKRRPAEIFMPMRARIDINTTESREL